MFHTDNGVPMPGKTVEQITPHPSWVRFWKKLIEIELDQAAHKMQTLSNGAQDRQATEGTMTTVAASIGRSNDER